MAIATDRSVRKVSFLDRPVLATMVINWEMVLYGVIFIAAVIARFYALGDRVMSHDESLHALFSYKLYNGEGYIHDPLMHGPFQFHIVALSYLLFGDNDFSARIPAALFGVALTILPYWFRPWLGRIGALVTSLGLLISPTILYYERYIRNESFILLFTALMALALFAYMRTRQIRWLYIGAVAVSLALSSKEVAYIHGFIGVVFIGAAFAWETIAPNLRKVWGLILLACVPIMIFAGNALNGLPLEGIIKMLVSLVMITPGILLGILTISLNVDRRHKPVSSAVLGLKDPSVLVGPVILAAVIFVVLHTTFFTNPKGIQSGLFGAVEYWLKQQHVQRGSQPTYYYLLLMSLYEFMPFFIGIIGGIVYLIKKAPSHLRDFVSKADSNKNQKDEEESVVPGIYPSDGGTFAAYLIFWAIGSYVLYTWAGEKMPWLNVHIALPFVFLFGHITQTVFDRFDWQVLKTREGRLFTLLLPLAGAAIVALLGTQPFQGQESEALRATSRFLLALASLIVIGIGLWYYGRYLQRTQIKPILYLVVVTILTILTIRFAWLSSFVNYDYVNEFLVYAHGAPDVKWVLNEIDDISRRTVGEKQIKVAYGGVIWPLEWYMREYPNKAFFGSKPNRDALDAPAVIFSPDPDVSLEQVEPYLGDKYERFTYRQVWWPIEDYKDLSFAKIWHTYFVPDPAIDQTGQPTIRDNWKSLWNIIFYRRYDRYKLSEWPYRTQMYLFVRKDVVSDLWDYRTGPLTAQEIPVDPYTDVRQELSAAEVWGSEGQIEGHLSQPRAMAIGPDNLIYIADSGNHRIEVFDQSGNFVREWAGTAGAEPGELSEPWGIAVSQDGQVYVSDTWNHRILIFDQNGTFLKQFGTFADTQGEANQSPGAFWGPRDIVIDAEGNVYVSDTGNKRVEKFSKDGQFIGAWGGGGIVPGRFDEPVGLAIDQAGNIYVADTWNQRIQKFDAAFNYISEWPVVGWDSQDVVNKPFLVIDEQDRVFVSDPQNYRVIVYNTDGKLLGVFGQYGQENNAFNLPLDLAIGSDGTLFVLDAGNNRVMKFHYPATETE